MKRMALIFLSALAFSNSADVNDAPEFSGKSKESIISGSESGNGNTGKYNVFLGNGAGKNSKGNNRINIGYLSGEDSEGGHNVGIGFSSFKYSKGDNNVSIGLHSGSNVEGINNTSIGGSANGFYIPAGRKEKKKFNYSTAVGWFSSNHASYSTAVGASSISEGILGTALGTLSNAKGEGSISAGAQSVAEEKLSSTLGYGSKASVVSSVSLGALSEATTESGVVGKMFEGKFENDDDKLYEFVASQSNQKDLNTKEAYEKLLNSIEKKNEERKNLEKNKEELEKWDADNKAKLDEDIKKRDEFRSELIVWKSNLGAVSIGADGKYTRQLTNLAAGTKATDAVNLAQLESAINSVDSKIKGLSNIEAVYYDDKGNELVKGEDDKYKTKTGEEVSSNKVKEVVKIKGTAKQIINVSSGLGLSDEDQEENKQKLDETKKVLESEKEKLKKLQDKLAESEKNEAEIKEKIEELKDKLNSNPSDEKIKEKIKIEEANLEIVKTGPLKQQKAELEKVIEQKQTEISKLEENLDSEKVKQLVNDELKDKEKNVATVRDLKEVAKAGIEFSADSGEVKKSLGQSFAIKGDGTIRTKINEKGDLVISLDKNGKIKTGGSTLDEKGLTVNKIKLEEISEEEAKKISSEKIEEKDGKKYKKTIDTEAIKAHYGNESISFKDKDRKTTLEIDGKNKTIRGLADLNDNSDGTSAANKNYVDSKVLNLGQEISYSSAMSAALSGLKALDYDPLRPSQFTAAMGSYKGKAAIALGLNHYISENTMVNGALSFNFNGGKDVMFNIGFAHKFGNRKEIEKLPKKYQAGPVSSIYVMQDEIQKLNKEKDALEEKMKNLEKENAEIKQMLKKILKK